MSRLLAAVAGAVFGIGLVIAGMTQPSRVIAFLDPRSGWDPGPAFVIAGALATYAIAYRAILRRRTVPWFDVCFHTPNKRDIDLPLVAGAAMFGAGWGLGGLCPGPAIVAAASGNGGALLFVAAMLAGMALRRAQLRSRVTRTGHGA